MAIMFQGVPGRVVRLDDPATQGKAYICHLDPDITFDAQLSIITGLTLSQRANVQFLHTLGGQVFIYVFGDRIGEMIVSGLSFAAPCDGKGGDIGPNHGAGKILAWYRDNRVAARQTPITMTIGQEAVQGFVTGVGENVVDPSTLLTAWNVQIQVMPDNRPGNVPPANIDDAPLDINIAGPPAPGG